MSLYPDYYDYGYSDFGGVDAEAFTGVGLVVLAILGIVLLIALAWCILSYVLTALGMYTMAKRRGIHNPWLAWIPVGNVWLLGSISDQYQYVAKGNTTNRRKILLGIDIALVALSAVSGVMGCIAGVMAAVGESVLGVAGAVAAVEIIITLATVVLSIVSMVYAYIAYYDLFASSKPGNATVFLVLGILFTFLLPFFVFASRKYDEGMPPRKQPQPEIPYLPVIEENDPVAEDTDFAEPVQDPVQEPVPEPEASPEEIFADESDDQ